MQSAVKHNLAPIVLFVYNRPWHTEQTLNALMQNDGADESVLYIIADGAKENANAEQLQKIQEVREVIRKKQWCKEVHIEEKTKNWGLADSIIEGVTRIVNQYGRIIVLEDDIVTAKGFLSYMNQGLAMYENEEQVMHISGYMFPTKVQLPETFFLYQTSSWGWATWHRAWTNFQSDDSKILAQLRANKMVDKFNTNGTYNYIQFLIDNITEKNKTWAIKWYGSVFLKNGLCLFPSQSLVKNIGFDGSGENCGNSDELLLNQTFQKDYVAVQKQKLVVNDKALTAIKMHNNPNLVNSQYKKYSMFAALKKLIKNKINNFLLKVLDVDALAEIVHEKNINKVINDCISQVELGEHSKFYEQARVFNLQNNNEKIRINNHTHIRGELLIFPFGGEIIVGDNCYIGEHTRIWSAEHITIGNNILISHNVNIMDTNSHELNHLERTASYAKMLQEGHPKIKPNIKTAPIVIENYVWINFNVVVAKGVTIGEGAIIAPNSVVTTNVPPFSLFAGSPAKLIKYLNE